MMKVLKGFPSVFFVRKAFRDLWFATTGGEQIKMQGKWLDEKDAKLNLAGKELVKQRNELRAIKQSL